MLKLKSMVGRMADQKFVQPIRKALLSDYSVEVDLYHRRETREMT